MLGGCTAGSVSRSAFYVLQGVDCEGVYVLERCRGEVWSLASCGASQMGPFASQTWGCRQVLVGHLMLGRICYCGIIILKYSILSWKGG